MGFLGLWSVQGNVITPATPSAAVDVVQAGAELAFFGASPTAQESKQANLNPATATNAQIATFVNTLQESLGAYGLVA